MDKVTLTIDGLKVTVDKGTTVLNAALQNGIYIPHLCYHQELPSVGVCRLCLVEIEGMRGFTISCHTPVAEGMMVKTETEALQKTRQAAVELLLTNHHGNCLECSQNTTCKLQFVARYIGVDEARLKQMRRPTELKPIDTSNPFFIRDPNKCVLCGICIRTCAEVPGVNAIDFAFRGYATTVGTFADKPLTDSRCESCGECLVRCPVGALAFKETAKAQREVNTICVYCGCGCGITYGVRGNTIVSARGTKFNPVNKGVLCVKGRFGYKFVNHEKRLTTPLIRKDGELVEASWDEALDLVAEKFAASKGDKFAAIASAKCTNEDNYLAQKFTRVVMKTNNIDHCARL